MDTGSVVTMIKESVCNQMGISQFKMCRKTLISYSKDVIQTLGLVKLEVKICTKIKVTHEFIVVADKYMDNEVLLGADLIGRAPFAWNAELREITWGTKVYQVINGKRGKIWQVKIRKLNLEEKVKNFIQADQRIVLKPGEFCYMSNQVHNVRPGQVVMVEGCYVKAIHRKVIPNRSILCEVSLKGYIDFPLVNYSRSKVKIKPGTILAEVFPIQEQECNYLTFTGTDLGSLEEVVTSLKTRGKAINLCHNHFQIIFDHCKRLNPNDPWLNLLERTVITKCEICMPKVQVDKVDIINDMLPHSDTAPSKDLQSNPLTREERLQRLIRELDLSNINKTNQTKLIQVLLQHLNLFILDDTEMGKISVEKTKIPMVDSEPVRMPLYRHPEQAKEIIAHMIEDMLEKDIIETSTAIYLAPIVLVNKPNGSKRLCIDFRGVNTHIKHNIHPLPRLDALVEEVAGKEYYCTLDMKDAYYQVVLDKESRDITTFSDGLNLYRFKRLPFGLSVSPAIFTKVMQEVLGPLMKDGWVKNYLDDVIIYANSYDKLMERLKLVLIRFEEMGLKLNISKCSFAQKEIHFLGHILSKEGIKPDPKNIIKIQEMKPPINQKQVRRFIGMCSFYRRFIADFSQIATPLTNLMGNSKIFHWDNECQSSFESLKQKLITTPVLVRADLTKQFELHTDASNTHLGGVLMQVEEKGLKPIGYFSKKLNRTEQKYACTDKEAMAIVHSCRYFHHYLWAKTFKIVTDHQPLTNIFKKRTHSPRMSRYLLEMREYNFQMEYKKGRKHKVPDALSRPMGRVREKVQSVQFLGLTREVLQKEQKADPRWKKVLEYFDGKDVPSKIPGNRSLSAFEMVDDILYMRREEFSRITLCLVVPESLRAVACHIAHEDTHMGEHKTVRRARQYFYWPQLWRDVVHYVKSCNVCQQFRKQGTLSRPWHELPTVEEKGKRIAIDLIDLHNSREGYRYCLTVIDHFSRFVRAYPLRNKSTKSVIKEFRKDMCVFGKPTTVLMDNGSEFTSREFRTLCTQMGINQAFCMPYNPQGNSVLERAHRTLKSVLAKLSEKHPNLWVNYLYETVRVINESVHLSLGTSPFFVQYGYHPNREVGKITLPELDEEGSNNDQTIQEIIQENIRKNTQDYRIKANMKRKEEKLVVGNLAWIFNEETLPGTATKLNKKWVGPYKIIQVIGVNKAYQLENVFDGSVVNRSSEKVKPYISRQDILTKIEDRFITESENEEFILGTRNRQPPERWGYQ